MFGWLFGKPRFRFYEDSYARTRAGMLKGVRQALVDRLQQGESFLIVTHFADSFFEIQDQLDAWSMDYQINSQPINGFAASRLFKPANPRIVLSLAGLLRAEDTAADTFEPDNKICVMVLERHPSNQHDAELEGFCRAVPCHVEMGYFLSFEDAVVSELIDDSILRILDLFGMGENELVTSNMISRRLKNVLKHNARFYASDRPADSARQWLEFNRKT